MNGIELQDRRFFASIREGASPRQLRAVPDGHADHIDALDQQLKRGAGSSIATVIYTTAPGALHVFREAQLAALKGPAAATTRRSSHQRR